MVLIGSIGVFAVGVMVVVWGFHLLNMEGFSEVTAMTQVDAGFVEADSESVVEVCVFVIIAGFLTMVLAGLGCAATHTEAKVVLCTYFALVFVLSMFFLAQFLTAVQFSDTLQPIVERQAEELCNATYHPLYSHQLGCEREGTRAAPSSRVCGLDCQDRVALISKMGGCKILHMLCHNLDYDSVGEGYCVVQGADGASMVRPQAWLGEAPAGSDGASVCRQACSADVRCIGYFTPSAQGCGVVAPEAPALLYGVQAWVADPQGVKPVEGSERIKYFNGTVGVQCDTKGLPHLIVMASKAARDSAILSAVAFVVLLSAATCACGLQYTFATKRKGRKGMDMLCVKMLFPCCFATRQRKFGFMEERDEEEPLD